jgi:glycosyltransferase involved in cell wall biosynthesis
VRVSIIITCYDREHFIGRAIRSAISQRFPPDQLEVIVVDDGSKDNSRAIIRDFGDAIVPIFNKRNMGLPAARNLGIRRARGRFVLHLDSDDYMHEDLVYIEEMHLAHNPGWGAVSCDYVVVDEHERHMDRADGAQKPIACGIMFRKESLIDIGLYDESLRYCEDEDLRIRFLQKYPIGHVYLPLYRYTRHRHNMTNDEAAMAAYRRKVARKHRRTGAKK